MPAQPSYSFADLVSIMSRLRAPEGCPWDREQTHESILSCLIEESYEFVDAVERKDFPNMREELGDLLLQVVFHAEMAREAGTFSIEEVVSGIAEKLVRRHPHVFAEVAGVDSADKVAVQWDEIKKQEKGAEKEKALGALGEIPKHLPALLKALKISKRAVKAGFEWPDWTGVAAKVREELAEFEAEVPEKISGAPLSAENRDALEMELGDLLFSVVNLGRVFDIDPERALARTNAKFTGRFQAMEKMADEEGKPFAGRPIDEMEALWVKAKTAERNGNVAP
jgi:MazG family protein